MSQETINLFGLLAQGSCATSIILVPVINNNHYTTAVNGYSSTHNLELFILVTRC